LSTIHGRHVCKDKERKITILAIQSKKAACGRFSKQLLDIDDGKVTTDKTGCIQLPTDFCIIIDSQDARIDQIFPNVHRQYKNHEWLAERAILAAKNVDVYELNLKIQHLLPRDLVLYKPIDTVCDATEAVNYPTEFLNSLDLPDMPPHNLQLKVGFPIILLRNLNPLRLCNGTRLVVKKINEKRYRSHHFKCKFRGENLLLPRIPIIPTDVAIQFKLLQFQIRLAFAMTINKFQGQTMSVCGLDLSTSCFSHGQFYVACSRTIQFVCVGERWDKKKYCTLCCIKGLILFFTNIVMISDMYNFKGSILINY
jgi:ATP-dependent DNA helicase PIF1